MGNGGVKRKFPTSIVIATVAAFTFLLSWLDVFPKKWVENQYARRVFPTISHIAGAFADAAPFSWLDVAIIAAIAILIYVARWRRGRMFVGIVSAAYLWFFWSWGLNYHRPGLAMTLGLDGRTVTGAEMDAFTQTAATELNRLWPIASNQDFNESSTARFAADRVRSVISRIDGTDWDAAHRIKRSLLAGWWLKIAGVDGMFNPFGHEPVVASTLLPFEMPFIDAHELAHVRGVPNEGDANLIAVFACIPSNDARFQYSGWFHLWLYLRSAERDKLLDPGPRRDLQSFFDRVRSQEIPWASSLQSAVLDWHLKANSIPEGVRSYEKFVTLAVASRDRWDEFAAAGSPK